MKLKRIRDNLDGLSDAIKELYTEKDGKFYLDAEEEDVSGLKNALNSEKEEARKAKEKAKALQDQIDAAANLTEEAKMEKLRSEGKIKDIEESWKAKVAEVEKTNKDKNKRLIGVITESMAGGAAKALAARISTVPTLMADAIRKRLVVEFDDQDNPTLRVLSADGKNSALSFEDLEKELVDDKAFAPIIIANRSSGGGSSGQEGSGGSGSKKPSEYTEQERVALYRSNPEEYNRIFPPQL